MTPEQVDAEAKRLTEMVSIMADRIEASGNAPLMRADDRPGHVLQRPLGARYSALHAAASNLIPHEWDWRVVEIAGGGAEFHLNGYRDPAKTVPEYRYKELSLFGVKVPIGPI